MHIWIAIIARVYGENCTKRQQNAVHFALDQATGNSFPCTWFLSAWKKFQHLYFYFYSFNRVIPWSRQSPDLNCHLRFLGRTYRTLPEVIGDLRTTPLHDEDSGEDIWCRRICPNLPFNNVMTPYKRTKWKMFRTLSTIYEWYMEYWSLFYKVHGIHTVL